MTKGDRIKHLRTDRSMTQSELASLLGTTKQTIYKYENGTIANIPSDRIEAIAQIFKVSPAYILGWPNNDDPESHEAVIETTDLSKVKSKFIESVMSLTDEQIILLQAVANQMLR